MTYVAEGTGVASGPMLTFDLPDGTSASPIGTLTLRFGVYNSGTTAISLPVSGVVLSGAEAADVSVSSVVPTTCFGTLAVGGSCLISLDIKATHQGLTIVNATLTDSTSGQSFTAAIPILELNAASPTVSTTSLSLGSTAVDTTAGPASVTVTTTGGDPITASLSSAAVSYGFALSKASCAAGETPCLINVLFTPPTTGSIDGVLAIYDPLTFGTTNVTVSGTGTAPPVYGVAGVSPTSLPFTSRPVGTMSISQTVTLSNTGAASFTISSIAFTGANAGEFNVSSTTCGTSLAASSSCVINVQFAPTVVGSKTASLVVSGDVNAGLPLSVGITGAAY